MDSTGQGPDGAGPGQPIPAAHAQPEPQGEQMKTAQPPCSAGTGGDQTGEPHAPAAMELAAPEAGATEVVQEQGGTDPHAEQQQEVGQQERQQSSESTEQAPYGSGGAPAQPAGADGPEEAASAPPAAGAEQADAAVAAPAAAPAAPAAAEAVPPAAAAPAQAPAAAAVAAAAASRPPPRELGVPVQMAAVDVRRIPVLPDLLRQKEGKRDLPMICHIEGCGLDLSTQAEYYQRYRICKQHLKSPALLVDGVPQRFCQQCGRFHDLQEFDGEKRNCRARLEQHNSRRRKVFVTAQSTRRSRYNKDKPLQARLPGGEGEEGGGAEPMAMDEGPLPPQYNSRGRPPTQRSQLAGVRRDRSTMEEADLHRTLSPQEQEALLLLSVGGGRALMPHQQQPQQQQQQPMPRFMSEPVRGPHGWRAGGQAGADAGALALGDEELMLLHPQLQDLLGQQRFLARQEQLAAAAGRLSGGGSAFTSLTGQHGATRPPSMPSFPSEKLVEMLASAGANASGAGVSGNPFASGATDAAGGVYRTLTEPAVPRGPSGAPQPRAQPMAQQQQQQAQGQAQALVPTIPRDGLSSNRPQSAAELLRALHRANAAAQGAQAQQGQPPPQPPGQSLQQAAAAQQQQQHALLQQPQQQQPAGAGSQSAMANPFMQQRGTPPLPPSNPLAGINMAALLGAAAAPPGGGMPKASTLLRQMAELQASAEHAMEQAALMQVQAAGSRPLMDAFPAQFHLAAAEELMRGIQGSGGSGSGGQAGISPAGVLNSAGVLAGGPYRSSGGMSGGSGGSGGGGSGPIAAQLGGLGSTDLLAALTGLAPPADRQQAEQGAAGQPQVVVAAREQRGQLPEVGRYDGLWGAAQGQGGPAQPPPQLAGRGGGPQQELDPQGGLAPGPNGNLSHEQLLAALLTASQGGSGAQGGQVMQDIVSLLQTTGALSARPPPAAAPQSAGQQQGEGMQWR